MIWVLYWMYTACPDSGEDGEDGGGGTGASLTSGVLTVDIVSLPSLGLSAKK